MRRLLLVVIALSACGDPLAGGDFEGDVKLSFQAIVCGEQHQEIVPANPQLGILWKQIGPQGSGFTMTEVTPIDTPVFPALVEVEILDLPPRDADLGCPIVFDDLDGDERYGSAEPILAVSWNELIGFDRDADSFQLLEGVCNEDGTASGEMTAFERPVNVSFLEAASQTVPAQAPGSCVSFF